MPSPWKMAAGFTGSDKKVIRNLRLRKFQVPSLVCHPSFCYDDGTVYGKEFNIMTFGEKLQELRRKAGMSQDTLSEKLEVSRQAVSKWERDETMPETEKVVRIAQLFGVSIDYLLLADPVQENPQPQAQQRTYTKQNDHYRTQIRRHGYKIGYIPMAIGALICVFSLLMYAIWPSFGNSFFGSMDDFGSFDMFPSHSIILEGGEELTQEIEEAILDAMEDELGSSWGGSDFLWDSSFHQMDSMMDNALKSQASLFLIGLLPGGVLMAVGVFIVVKGKKYAASNSCG